MRLELGLPVGFYADRFLIAGGQQTKTHSLSKNKETSKIHKNSSIAKKSFRKYFILWSMPSSTQRAWSDQNKLALHVSSLCRRGLITSSYLTKVALYLLGDGVSSIEDRRSATLKRVALTSLKLADCAAASWQWWPSLSHGREHVCRRLVCREWRRSPESLHWEVSRSTLDYHLSWGGSVQLSPRFLSVADQRVKVQFQNLNVECGNLQVQCPNSDVGSENLKDKC